MLIDRIELRPADREEVEENPHHQPDIVAPEGDPAGRFIELRIRSGAVTQAEIDQAEREQAERAEQRGMGVVEGQECAMLIIIDQRSVERAAAEHTGADEIPERRSKDEQIGKAVVEPFGSLRRLMARCCEIASRISSTSGSTSMNENIDPSGTHMLGPPPSRDGGRCRERHP